MKLVLDSSVLSLYLSASPDPVDTNAALWWNEVSEMMKIDSLSFYIPAPALTEVLCAFREDKRHHVVPILFKDGLFKLLNYDDACALEASKLLGEEMLSFRKSLISAGERPPGRECAKIDMFIMGAALANKIGAICTYDNFFSNVAKRRGLDIQVFTPRELLSIYRPQCPLFL